MLKKIMTIVIIAALVLIGGLYLFKDHGVPTKILIQNELEKTYMDDFKSGDYTIDNPLVILNPYESNELAAYVGFNSDQKVSYEYTVNGNIPFTYTNEDLSNTVIIPVVGLYNNTLNKVDITTYDSSGAVAATTQIEISTEDTSISEEISTADVINVKEDEFTEFMDGKFLIDNYTNIYDADGNLRGFNIAPDSGYAYMKIVDDKFLVPDKWSENSKYNKVIYSYSFMGRVDPDLYFISPEGTKFHHDFVQVGDELYALTSSVSEDSDFADSMIESLVSVYSLNGKLQTTFDLSEYFSADDELPNLGTNVDDLHLNSIDYYEEGNMLILDSRSYSSFMGYNLDTNQVEWLFDNPDTVGADLSDILLTPQGEMEYPSGQHTAFVANDFLTEDQKQDGMLYISIFDNRQCVDEDENEITKTVTEDPDLEACQNIDGLKSRGILYEIDLENMTVSTVWTIDFDSYSSFKGGFNLLADGFKETYVANATSFEVYNADNELIGEMKLHTREDATSEDDPFLYRANTFSTELLQSFVEIA